MFPGQRGVALVITLVLLSVITFLAITFLAVTRREKGSVTSTADQTDARFAADSALERAKIQVLTPGLAFSNQFKVEFLVSTNFINGFGFEAGKLDPTNVNYDHQFNSPTTPLTPQEHAQNIANLLYDPRPPVFVQTNRDATRPLDFRYYLDLNRNGRYDTNGFQPAIGPNGGYLLPSGLESSSPAGAVINTFMGDPEWIGVLERPDRPHSSTNKFIARYAYAVVPTSQSLDLNYIHNAVKGGGQSVVLFNEGFLRNQGVGSWELNLAAFLTDLNTNVWANPQVPQTSQQYQYRQPFGLLNQGNAFLDALALLSYRYGGKYNTLKTANQFFGLDPNTALPKALRFQSDLIDEYSDGLLTTNTWLLAEDASQPATQPDQVALPWAGSDNTNHFFTLQEILNPGRSSILFTNRLGFLGTSNSSYDRYTFYRMMAQMGTDSAPDNDKININYDNKAQKNPISGAVSATNLFSWQPINFFIAAADRLLRDPNLCPYSGLSITNIPIWTVTPNRLITNFYSPAVHRLLQVAANIYDATTNRIIAGTNAFPSVFRPVFTNDGTTVYITGYEEVPDASSINLLTNMLDLEVQADRDLLKNQPNAGRTRMVYGVPLIIGAKKGFPNFNEVAVESVAQVARRLEFRKAAVDGPVTETNQMYTIGITNFWGFEAWNSYAGPYQGSVDVIARFQISAALTNEIAGFNGIVATNAYFDPRGIGNYDFKTNVQIGRWPGYPTSVSAPLTQVARSFVFTNSFYTFIPNMIYRQYAGGGGNLTNLSAGFPRNNSERFPVPTWGLTLRSRLLMVMVDTSANRIIDYVNIDQLGEQVDIMKRLAGDAASVRTGGQVSFNASNLWNTNRPGNTLNVGVPTYGILDQVSVNLGSIETSPGDWKDYAPSTADKAKGIDEFRVFMGLSPVTYQGSSFTTTNIMQAPFNPAAKVHLHYAWQANDPLVHYTTGDLLNLKINPDTIAEVKTPNQVADILGNIHQVNAGTGGSKEPRYQPWGGKPGQTGQDPETDYHLELKDPLMTRSDNWDFPTNKFPNVGWLGRVHRGTPWQTIYLKSQEIDTNTWTKWSGHVDPTNALWSLPTRDRILFDHFTAAPNENATRGQLGVNQSELAAWSAVLSGVQVLSNNLPDNLLRNRTPAFAYLPITPAGVSGGTNSPLWYMVHGINNERGRTNSVSGLTHPAGSFQHVGDVLGTPELTVSSPYLNTNSAAQLQSGISDAVYERIPQQIMGLLNLSTPRFEIYSYGQSLKPAPRSIVTSGAQFGLCTNYQITAEVVTRSVVRMVGSLDPNQTNNPSADKNYPPRTVVESFNILPPE